MNILSAQNLEKTVKDEPLFTNLTFGLEKGEKIGIVGKNGAGKSTLLKVLAKEIVMDEGILSIKNGADVAYLEQNVPFSQDDTIESFFFKSKSTKVQKLKEYYDSLKSGSGEVQSKLYEEVEKDDLFSVERNYYALIDQYDIKRDKDALMKELSGGEAKKVHLARTLASKSDIILLDEPTNHLDIKTIEEMEEDLKDPSISAIIVTHDRAILDSVCTTILELDRSSSYKHPGSYSSYIERKAERLKEAFKQQERMRSVLRRELKWLSRAPKARTGKDKGRIERAKELEEEQKKEVYEKKIREFTSEKRRLGKKILDLKDLSKSYEERVIFSPFSFIFEKNMKIALVGDNGSGKSTFLDVITEHIQLSSGVIEKGLNTVYGYYDQKSRDLNEKKSVIEYINDIGETIELSEDEVVSSARFLELFGFNKSMHNSPIYTLSGGEKRRLYLISRLVMNPNFLILDEPTNDLDIDTMESLEDYITSFSGPVLICSHDRTFLNITTDTTLEIKNGKLTFYPIPFSDYHERMMEEEKEGKKAEVEERRNQEARVKKEDKKRKLTFKEQKEYEGLLFEIDELEAKVKEIEDSFSSLDPKDFENLPLREKEYHEKKEELDKKIERFLELDEFAK